MPSPKNLSPPVQIRGYFQSERYFLDCKDIIFEEFQLVRPARREAQVLLDRIGAAEAVCVHVRRGDYVSNAATSGP